MTIFEVDIASDLPVWVQLRNRFVYLIKVGHFKPGDQLPSVRSLAAEAAINYNTVSKAYVNLEHDGYVVSVRGRGVFVREAVMSIGDDVAAVADAIIEESVRRCLSMGVPANEVRRRMSLVIDQLENSEDYLSTPPAV